MRILVGWDHAGEAETLSACLSVENVADVFTSEEKLLAAAAEPYDAVVLALNFPSEEGCFPLFERLRGLQIGVPIIGGWQSGDVVRLARFISHGLESHINRDAGGDFIFLLTGIIEATHSRVQAERSRMLAERLREEIDAVRRLQESVIPREIECLKGYHIAARYEPSQINVSGGLPVVMAGGDYYDVFTFDECEQVLLLGDASGHGVKACMSIMTMHTLIRMLRERRSPDTARFVTQVNRRLCENDIVRGEGGFITLIYCVLNGAEGRFTWTSAGHPPPILQDLATGEVTHLTSEEAGGLPLAIEEEWEFDACSVQLPRHCRLLLYTDGLEEAFPEGADEEDQFGVEGIIASLKSSAGLPLEGALDRLFDDSAAATAGYGRHDDTSVILLERGG